MINRIIKVIKSRGRKAPLFVFAAICMVVAGQSRADGDVTALYNLLNLEVKTVISRTVNDTVSELGKDKQLRVEVETEFKENASVANAKPLDKEAELASKALRQINARVLIRSFDSDESLESFKRQIELRVAKVLTDKGYTLLTSDSQNLKESDLPITLLVDTKRESITRAAISGFPGWMSAVAVICFLGMFSLSLHNIRAPSSVVRVNEQDNSETPEVPKTIQRVELKVVEPKAELGSPLTESAVEKESPRGNVEPIVAKAVKEKAPLAPEDQELVADLTRMPFDEAITKIVKLEEPRRGLIIDHLELHPALRRRLQKEVEDGQRSAKTA